jgi:hypothetical protein
MAKTRPTNGKDAEDRHATYWEAKCLKSDLAVGNLQAHDGTRSTMEKEFADADRKCAEIAQRLIPLRVAASPAAANLEAELFAARATRDAIRWRWNLKREQLRREVENFSLPEIEGIKKAVAEWGKVLFAKRELFYVASDGRSDQVRFARIKNNFAAVAAAVDELFKRMRAIDGMRESPLREIIQATEELGNFYRRQRDFVLDEATEELRVSEHDYMQMQASVALHGSAPDPLKTQRIFRHGIPY